jgi:hypothetical protein
VNTLQGTQPVWRPRARARRRRRPPDTAFCSPSRPRAASRDGLSRAGCFPIGCPAARAVSLTDHPAAHAASVERSHYLEALGNPGDPIPADPGCTRNQVAFSASPLFKPMPCCSPTPCSVDTGQGPLHPVNGGQVGGRGRGGLWPQVTPHGPAAPAGGGDREASRPRRAVTPAAGGPGGRRAGRGGAAARRGCSAYARRHRGAPCPAAAGGADLEAARRLHSQGTVGCARQAVQGAWRAIASQHSALATALQQRQQPARAAAQEASRGGLQASEVGARDPIWVLVGYDRVWYVRFARTFQVPAGKEGVRAA